MPWVKEPLTEEGVKQDRQIINRGINFLHNCNSFIQMAPQGIYLYIGYFLLSAQACKKRCQ